MSAVTIESILASQDGHRIEIEVRVQGQKQKIFFQTDEAQLTPNPEAAVAVALLPAMKHRIDEIEVDGEVSPAFVRGLDGIQNKFREWKPNYGRVRVNGKTRPPAVEPDKRKTGVFFSAGLDSFYSFLQHRDEVDVLVHLDGFDVPLSQTGLRQRVKENMRRISQAFDIPVITVETNARDFLEKFVAWSFAHGSAMASVGYLLAPEIGRMMIAPFGAPRHVYPFGSHPELDPHWSSELITFEHDPKDVDKIEKSRYLAGFEAAREMLHVCLRYPEEGLNCGECAKCLRSMVYMQAAGVYGQFSSFGKPLNLEALARYHEVASPDKDTLYRALQMLEEQGTYPETVKALQRSLYPPGWREALKKQVKKIRKQAQKRFGVP